MASVQSAGQEISVERQMLKRSLTLLPLFGIIYFTVCGGLVRDRVAVQLLGAGLALLLIALIPFIYSVPNILMVRELQSMMPVEGGYYHWTKQAFGPFDRLHDRLDELGGLLGGRLDLPGARPRPISPSSSRPQQRSGRDSRLGAPVAVRRGADLGDLLPADPGVPPGRHDQHLDGRRHAHPADPHVGGRLRQLGSPRQHLPRELPPVGHRSHRRFQRGAVRGHVELHGIRAPHVPRETRSSSPSGRTRWPWSSCSSRPSPPTPSPRSRACTAAPATTTKCSPGASPSP